MTRYPNTPNTPAVSISNITKKRYRYKCKNRHIALVDVDMRETSYEDRGRVSRRTEYMDRGQWRNNPPIAICPECGLEMYPKENRVTATRTEKPCGSECLCARGEECNCACGGENHGLKYLKQMWQNGLLK